MQALLSVIRSATESMTKIFSVAEDGKLEKGKFRQPSEFTLRNIKAADTANKCIQQLLKLIQEGFGLCLGYHQCDAKCLDKEIDIVPKAKFEQWKRSAKGYDYDPRHNVLNKIFHKSVATRTKLVSKNRTEKSKKDFTNMQNARVVAFDIDVHPQVQYNDVEMLAMSSVDNYVKFLDKLLPEMNFGTAAFLATVSTSAKVRKDGEPELPFSELSKRGMHIYFVVDEDATGYDHKKFEETVKARLLSAGLMRPIPRKHTFSDKVNAGIELTVEEKAFYGLPNGTIFVTAEILDTAIPNDINRVLFEADPILPDGWSTHSDRYYQKEGGFVTFSTLPYESVRNKDKAVIKATFKKEILNRKWFKLDKTEYTRAEVIAHIDNTAFSVVDSELNYTLDLTDTLILETVLDESQLTKNHWTVQEVYEFLKQSPCDKEIACIYSEMPERTVKLQTKGSSFQLFIPKMKMYAKLSAHSESILFRESAVDCFTDKKGIDDTGNAYNINLGQAIADGENRIVSKALHSTGKTHSMIAMASRDNTFSIVVAPLRALVNDLIAKFGDKGLKLLDYRDISKFRGNIADYDGIAVCAPSVHKVKYLVEQNKKKLCLLVDEVECILRSIYSVPELEAESIYKRPDTTIFTLQTLLKYSESFLLADADVGTATRDFMDSSLTDYIIHRNDTQKKLKADQTPAPAYINRFTNEGWPKCVADIASMVEKNREEGKKTIICSALKRSLTDVLAKIDCNRVALVASRDAKKDSVDMIQLIKEGDRFLENPNERLADYDVIGLSPRATNGLDITIKDDDGEELPAELIYIHDRVLNYTHEVCIQHILRLRGANPVHLWLSDHFRQTDHKTDEKTVAASYKARAAVEDIDVYGGHGLDEVAIPTAKYNKMRNDDSREFSQRLFGYLSRVGFALKTKEYCIDSSKSVTGSIQHMWQGEDAQLKWNNLVLTEDRADYTDPKYRNEMASFFYQSIIRGETESHAPFTSWDILDIDGILTAYSTRKLGELAIAECIYKIRQVHLEKGYKINKQGKRVGEQIEIPIIDYIAKPCDDPKKYLRKICAALGYDVKCINTRTVVEGMSDDESAKLLVKDQVKLLSIEKVHREIVPSVPVYCAQTGEHVDDTYMKIDKDFLADWLGYDNSLKALVLEKPLVDPVVH